MASRRDLTRYQSMRDFALTAEPRGDAARVAGHSFVVQKHDATRLHYDFRLELDGVLLSWAVPKGPSLDPKARRLAVQTEDHPLDYRDFEGTIPEGEYGGGPVIVWDRGSWTPLADPRAGLAKGHLDFALDGEKLHGRFTLIRTREERGKAQWLLFKRQDEHARTGKAAEIVLRQPESILSGRTIAAVAKGKGTARLPGFGKTAPQLATLVDRVPAGGEWLYELKYDGYRALATLDRGKVRIASRSGKDWTKKLPEIAEALTHLRARSALFDGEVCYVLPDGRSDFQMLQNALGSADRSRLVYFVFDLLHGDGVDLTGEPLHVRKDRLRTILAGVGPPLRLGDHVTGDGQAFFEEACKLGLEGIVAKRADRGYTSGRSKDWVKVKCQLRQELVIVGFTPPKGSRQGVGALVLGVHEGKQLRYAGKVGTGFTEASLRDLARRLKQLTVDEPAIAAPPRLGAVTWVRPELVCQVRFTEWTQEGALRHPAFEGLRADKRPADVERERPVAAQEDRVEGVKISHPERVLDPESGVTKGELAAYHAAVGAALLPYARHRPLMLLRAPATIAKTFVQKHGNRGMQAAAHIEVGKVEDEEVLTIATTRGAIELAQLGCVELHGWGSRLPRWDRPDWIVMDLDPDEGLPFARVVDAALELRDALATVDLVSFVKTTGGKGLHVVVPLAARHGWEVVRGFSEWVARALAGRAPERYVANMAKRARKGKIFIDYLRNAQGATAVLPYSPRARPGMGVAMPVAWEDLRKGLDPREFTVRTVPALLARRRLDPWRELLATKQALRKEVLAAVKEEEE